MVFDVEKKPQSVNTGKYYQNKYIGKCRLLFSARRKHLLILHFELQYIRMAIVIQSKFRKDRIIVFWLLRIMVYGCEIVL